MPKHVLIYLSVKSYKSRLTVTNISDDLVDTHPMETGIARTFVDFCQKKSKD